jgi:hypothetical protein
MNRYVVRDQVVYGHHAEYMAIASELVTYFKSKGWAHWTYFSPVTGVINEVVAQADFKSLADLERVMNEMWADAGFSELMGRLSAHTVQGASVSEILVSMGDND